ncbi:MAG: hypothetical protein ACRC0G_03170 [Fusobacteriaceae bacterium]
MDKKTKKQLEDLRTSITFNNPNILKNIVEFFQKVILLSVELEGLDRTLTPRLVLGEEPNEVDSSKTLEYERPVMYLTLVRRMSTGVNNETLKDLFSNNLMSGIPKFDRKVVKRIEGQEDEEDEEYEVLESMTKTDNELCLSLKTKTVKEQLVLLPMLERALNIYSQIVKPSYVDVCGVKSVSTKPKKDATDFETANIFFQLRVIETVTVDDTYILKGFEIIGNDSEFSGVTGSNGKIDENNNWVDNITTEYEEF